MKQTTQLKEKGKTQILYQTRYMNGKWAHEKVLNIISH